jgi:hypothetical protein
MIRLRSSRIAVALACLFALTACDLYPDSGKWAGDFTVHDEAWNDRYTCSADVDITHTNDVVSLNAIDSYCGSRSLHWSPSALNRRGMSLYRDDQKVGDVYPDGTVRIELTDPYYTDHYPNRAQRIVITWTRLGDDLQFSLTEYYEGTALVRESNLHRVN